MEDYKPFEIQKAAHRALLADNYKRAYLYWSRRTGKTKWSIMQLVLSCLANQGPHHMVFKEYQQAETVAWNEFIGAIPKQFIKGTPNKGTLTIQFHYMGDKATGEYASMILPGGKELKIAHNHKKEPSSIRLLGSDKADSHRGGESMGMVFDEYQDQDTYGWDFVYKFFLATTGGWSVFMGTAKDDDKWNNTLERAEINYLENPKGYLPDSDDEMDPVNLREYYSKATWRNNPNIKPAWVATERRKAEEEGSLGSFLQETELIPFSQQGAVYPTFSTRYKEEGGHMIKAKDIPKEGTDYIALDFGFTEGHAMAACFIRITRDDVWYQWDEIHGTGIQIDDLVNEIRQKMGDRYLTAIVADSARPDLIDYMLNKGLPVIPSPKKQNSIITGIELMRIMLKPKIQIMGPPRPSYFLADHCKKTKYDMIHYRYKEINEKRNPSELPEKKHDDAPDAIRYLKLWFKYGQQKDTALPPAPKFNEYGLPA